MQDKEEMKSRIKNELIQLKNSDAYRELHRVGLRDGGYLELRGKTVLDLTSWDFFDLNSNRSIKRIFQSEVEQNGINNRSPRLSSGTSAAHFLCESRIAKFLGTERALLFSSKNQAILSLFSFLLSEDDSVFIDEQVQSPVADACRLAGARAVFFNSANLSTLEKELADHKGAGDKYIFVESISPITGRKIDLLSVNDISSRFTANLIVDESFSLGIQGLRGAGGCEEYNLVGKVSCIVGALSYGLAGYGAFVASTGDLIELLINRSRTLTNEIPLPSALAAVTVKAIDIIEFFQKERDKIRFIAGGLRRQLSEAGFLDANQSDTPIVSIMVGKQRDSREMAEALFDRGFLVDSVHTKTSLSQVGFIRCIVSLLNREDQLRNYTQSALDIFQRLPPE